MAREEITRGVVGGDEYEVGQRVCIKGHGTANLVHIHGRVDRFTKTMMIVKYTIRQRYSGGVREIPGERRYRTGPGFGREVGGHEYGGSSVSHHCRTRRG